jgi:endonuclease/exonuclease/phosphatase family metal-dependent hydrolase
MKAKKKPPFIDRLFLWMNFVLCASILLSYLAPVIDPATFWPIAFFGLAYSPLLFANLIMLVYWLLRRKWYFILSLAGILIGFNVLINSVGFNLPSHDVARPGAGLIRLMTYNVHDFQHYGAHHDTSTKHQILQLLKEQQPDIIGFQEYYSRRKGSKFDMNDSLKSVLNTTYFYFEPFTAERTRFLGMAIFSKLPIVATGRILLSDTTSENQCLYIDVQKGAHIIRIYSVHLQSIGFDSKDYTSLDSASERGKTNMHSIKRMIHKLASAFSKRSEQVFKIKQDAAKCPYPYIISGDFNDTPGSFAFHQMVKGLKNAFREKGSGFCKTYNGDFPNYQIDYIMASPEFGIASYKVIEQKLSDHYPVRSDLSLNLN